MDSNNELLCVISDYLFSLRIQFGNQQLVFVMLKTMSMECRPFYHHSSTIHVHIHICVCGQVHGTSPQGRSKPCTKTHSHTAQYKLFLEFWNTLFWEQCRILAREQFCISVLEQIHSNSVAQFDIFELEHFCTTALEHSGIQLEECFDKLSVEQFGKLFLVQIYILFLEPACIVLLEPVNIPFWVL